ncbi:MAG: hypothetical protein GX076_05380 [Clostridiales bacterium]|nr:hypothetical protein [Clostridiales bacterium]
MNIRYLHEILSRIEEIRIIGKTTKVDGVICNVMGIVRYGTEMRLLILQYNELFEQVCEEREAEELCNDIPSMPLTNRMRLRTDERIDAINPFQSVSKVFIDEKEFEVYSSEYRRLSTQDWDIILTISRFLNNGWQPDGIGYQNIDMLFLTSLKLEGDYVSIPTFDEKPKLHFITAPSTVVHQVEKPVTLVIGGKYPDKLLFLDATTSEEHWVQINRVYLLDIWEEMDKTFADPRIQDLMSSEEIAQARLNCQKHLLEICPRGMYFPVIEYECEENITLQFYSKSFLDAKPLGGSGSMAFLIRPDKPRGILGLKLKAAVIQEPIPANTSKIEAELFQCIFTTSGDDILLDY